jgi:hypothetical protein
MLKRTYVVYLVVLRVLSDPICAIKERWISAHEKAIRGERNCKTQFANGTFPESKQFV